MGACCERRGEWEKVRRVRETERRVGRERIVGRIEYEEERREHKEVVVGRSKIKGRKEGRK